MRRRFFIHCHPTSLRSTPEGSFGILWKRIMYTWVPKHTYIHTCIENTLFSCRKLYMYLTYTNGNVSLFCCCQNHKAYPCIHDFFLSFSIKCMRYIRFLLETAPFRSKIDGPTPYMNRKICNIPLCWWPFSFFFVLIVLSYIVFHFIWSQLYWHVCTMTWYEIWWHFSPNKCRS